MQTTTHTPFETVDATAVATALYVQARDQYRTALNAAAALTCAGPNTRLRIIGQLDRCRTALRMANARLELMYHPGPTLDDLMDARD